MTFLPSVVVAEYRSGFQIRLTFNDGSEGTIDFRPWLEGPVFEPLRDPAYFKAFFFDGGTVAWPNGADIAPETLYEAAGRPASALTPTPSSLAVRRRPVARMRKRA